MLPGGQLLQARESLLAGPLAPGGVEAGAGDLNVGHDAREQEGAFRILIEVEAEDMPARLELDQRERLHPAAMRIVVPALEVVERDHAGLLDGALQRGEGRLAEVDAR